MIKQKELTLKNIKDWAKSKAKDRAKKAKRGDNQLHHREVAKVLLDVICAHLFREARCYKDHELAGDMAELQMEGCVGWRNYSLRQLVEAVWDMIVSPESGYAVDGVDGKWTWVEAEEVRDRYLSGEY